MLKYNYSNQLLLNYLANPSCKRIERMLNCEKYILLRQRIDENTGEVFYPSYSKMRCHDPLCAYCQIARKKLENFFIYQIIPSIIDNYSFIFLTINYPSVHITDYKDTIKKIHHIFNKTIIDKKLNKNINGFLSKIDYGKINYAGKINLHLHCILIMSKDYIFNADIIRDTINKHSETYIQNIDIEDLGNNVEEITKKCNYSVKPIDYFQSTSDIKAYINIIDEQRKNTKLYGFGGIYKKMRNEIRNNNKKNKNRNDEIIIIKETDLKNYIGID